MESRSNINLLWKKITKALFVIIIFVTSIHDKKRLRKPGKKHSKRLKNSGKLKKKMNEVNFLINFVFPLYVIKIISSFFGATCHT